MPSLRHFFLVALVFLGEGSMTEVFAQPVLMQDILSPDGMAISNTTTQANSPLRITLAQEGSYKVEEPRSVIKNRSSVQLEYSKYFLEKFVVQFKGKATAFLKEDHRHESEGTDVNVSQAFIQTSLGQTSFRVGVQTLPWGESILAPVTDEVSPRDNRELFNFNLEELRRGQPMVVIDHFSATGRLSGFWNVAPSFNKYPKSGTGYFFDPFTYGNRIEGDGGTEFGVSWRKNFEGFDITLMAANLLDNDYALRMNSDGSVTRLKERFSLTGGVFNYGFGNFVLRGEAAFKSSKPFNNEAMQVVRRKTIDTYLSLDYRYTSSLTLTAELVNQHILDWSGEIQGYPKDRQSVLFSMTKLMMNDDLSLNLQQIINRPYRGNLTTLMTTYKWDDYLTLGLNLIYPHSNDRRSGLWNVRDQKQIAFKVQYQF